MVTCSGLANIQNTNTDRYRDRSGVERQTGKMVVESQGGVTETDRECVGREPGQSYRDRQGVRG